MNMENETIKGRIIEGLESIETERDIRIEKLERELEELKEDQEVLIFRLLSLKSKVKNDEEEK